MFGSEGRRGGRGGRGGRGFDPDWECPNPGCALTPPLV